MSSTMTHTHKAVLTDMTTLRSLEMKLTNQTLTITKATNTFLKSAFSFYLMEHVYLEARP